MPTPDPVQCVHCRRLRPRAAMTFAALPGLPLMCRRGLPCYLAGVKTRFRDPWHWLRKAREQP